MFMPDYAMPSDVAGWLRAFACITERMSPVSLTDMTIPGNPMIYVNDAWCEATDFKREEVLGHNCRCAIRPARSLCIT